MGGYRYTGPFPARHPRHLYPPQPHRGLEWAALVILLLQALSFWLVSVASESAAASFFWLLCLLLTILLAVLLVILVLR